MLFFVIIFISCKEKQPENYVSTPELEVTNDSSLWTLGGVEQCNDPQSEVSYREASEEFGFQGENFLGPAVEGGMAFQYYQDEWWLWQVVPQQAVEGRTQDGQVIRYETDYPLNRLYILDINQDGKDDLLILGEFLDVVWSVQTEDEYRDVLIPIEHLHGVRDVGLIDIEGDGDLDLWVFQDHPELAIRGFIYKQEDSGEFSAPEIFAPADLLAVVFEVAVLDWDDDGDPDMYLCSDFGALHGGNRVLINENGSFGLGDAKGADIVADCMGVSIADMDRDGLLDLYLTEGLGHSLLKGSVDGFIDVTLSVGLSSAEEEQMLWGSQIIDYNNDGWFDILAGTSDLSGMQDPNDAAKPFPIWLFEQTEKDVYVEIGEELGFPQETLSRIILANDINQDGVQDLFISSAERLAYVYLSEGCTQNNWIELQTPSDSIVRVFADEDTWFIAPKPRGWQHLCHRLHTLV